MGAFGLGDRNDRGRMLIEFSRKNERFISNSLFKKRKNRRWTWTLGRAKNEIDFIMVRKSQRNLVLDVSIVNNFKINSEHRMLRLSFMIKAKPLLKVHQTNKKIIVNELIEKFNENLKENLQCGQTIDDNRSYYL